MEALPKSLAYCLDDGLLPHFNQDDELRQYGCAIAGSGCLPWCGLRPRSNPDRDRARRDASTQRHVWAVGRARWSSFRVAVLVSLAWPLLLWIVPVMSPASIT